MRKLLLILQVAVFCILLFSCNSTTSKTSAAEQRDNDTTAVAKPVPLADPFILLYDGRYYAYGTSPDSDQGFEVFYSDDLQSWTKHTEKLLKKEDSYGDRGFWAPEVYYHKGKNKFYLYYSAEEHICVATGDSPLGPFKQEVKKPMREEKGIDSSLFIDEDGTPYVFFVRFTNGNVIWVARLEDDWTTIKEETLTQCVEISQEWESKEGKVAEGASVIKHDGLYYLIYSGNDFRSLDYGVGYATAKSPFGPWTKATNNPILQRPTADLVGTGHGAYFVDKNNQYKYVFHSHFNTSSVAPRLMHIVDMSIKDKQITFDKNTIVNAYSN